MSEPAVLTVVFERPQDLVAQEAHLSRGAFWLPAPVPPPQPLADVMIVVIGPDGARAEVAGKVIQIAPAGMAVAIEGLVAVKERLAPLFAKAREMDADPTSPERLKDPVSVVWGHVISEADIGEPVPDTDDDPGVHEKIRGMNPQEKMHLAAHGDRTARLILMKDPIKTVHIFVLKNPRVTVDEIAYMAGFPQTNPDALVQIATNREWTQNSRIVAALVRNPKTPSTVAVRLLDRLPMSEVRRLAKSPNTPRAVSAAAKKKALETPG